MPARLASHPRCGLALIGLAAAAACGTTVPARTALPQASGPPVLGEVPPSGFPTASAPGSEPGATAAPGPGAGLPSVGSTVGPSGTPVQLSGWSRGFTDRTITLGFTGVKNQNTTNAQAGATGVAVSDDEPVWNAIVDDVNRHGGIAGRRVQAVNWALKAGGADTATQLQAACQDLTQDHTVFAVVDMLSGSANSDVLTECLEHKGIPHIVGSGSTNADASTFQRWHHYVEASSLSVTRLASNLVGVLASQNYFGANARIGLLAYDYPSFHTAVDKQLVPSLAQRGLKLDDVQYVNRDDSSALGSEMAAALLRFRNRGIDHVMFLETQADLAFLFMTAADKQAYQPRYGLNSGDGAQVLLNAHLVPASQLRNAVGFGWVPSLDVPAQEHRATALELRCLKIVRDHGLRVDNQNAVNQALSHCDMVWFAKASLEATAAATGGGLAADNLMSAIDSLGDRHHAVVTFGDYYDRAHRDGAAYGQVFVWAVSCGCLRYTGSLLRLR